MIAFCESDSPPTFRDALDRCPIMQVTRRYTSWLRACVVLVFVADALLVVGAFVHVLR